jgi:tetratricopeptide (TPR) repeat protein
VRHALARALHQKGRYRDALNTLEPGLELARQQLRDDELIAGLTALHGHLRYAEDENEAALADYARARELYRSASDPRTLADVYSGLSLAYREKGDARSALRYSRLALGILEVRDRHWEVSRELNELALRYLELGDLGQALEAAQAAVARSEQSGERGAEAMTRSTLATVLLRAGRVDEARIEAEVAREMAEAETDLARIDAWVVLARIAQRDGDYARADELFPAALASLEQTERWSRYADVALAYADALGEQNRAAEAFRYARLAAEARAGRPRAEAAV